MTAKGWFPMSDSTTPNFDASSCPHRKGLCTQFEEDLRSRQFSRVEEFLSGLSRSQQPGNDDLAELIRAEHRHRWHRGELPTLAEYKARFPDCIDLLEEAFFASKQEGGVPYALMYPLGSGSFGTVYR